MEFFILSFFVLFVYLACGLAFLFLMERTFELGPGIGMGVAFLALWPLGMVCMGVFAFRCYISEG